MVFFLCEPLNLAVVAHVPHLALCRWLPCEEDVLAIAQWTGADIERLMAELGEQKK
jgi:hypothetical protein